MRITFRLEAGIDDDLLTLYEAQGSTEFCKILKSVYLAYSTGLPFCVRYNLTGVAPAEEAEIRLMLDDRKYGKLLSELSLCKKLKKAAYLKAVARMYLTPSLLSYYTDCDEPAQYDIPAEKPAEKSEKVSKPKKERKPVEKKKDVPKKDVEEKPQKTVEKKETAPKQTPVTASMEDIMKNPEFVKLMMEQMSKIMPSQPILESEPVVEEGPKEGLDNNLAMLFGGIGSE